MDLGAACSHGKDDSGDRRVGVHRVQLHPAMDAAGRHSGSQPRQVDLRGQSAQPAAGFFRFAIFLYAGRRLRPRTPAQIIQTPPAPRHRALRGRESCGSFHPWADDFVRTNVFGTFCLLEEARSYCEGLQGHDRDSFRFLHVSTDEVYGSLGPNDPPFCETNPYSPNSPYSASKAGSDHLVRAYHHTYGLPTLTTNCSNNYGPYQF